MPLNDVPSLADKIWKKFLLRDLFTFEAGKCSQANQLTKSDKGIPYIGATNRNNGVLDFVEPDEKFINRGNAIAFVCDGEGSMGFSFYKAEDCIATTNIIFGYADFVNEFVGMFITTVADKVRGKYSYNYKRRLLRLRNEKIMLPVTDDGAPDFEFMENFIRAHETKILQRYIEFVTIADAAQIQPLSEKTWREFFIGDLFRLETGKAKGVNHLELDECGISYLGATNRNNAVLNFVRPVENLIQRGNCTAFIRNGEGSIGYSVYKREDFIATSDITCGYADFLNEYIGWFITTVADKVRGKYNFNYKRSDTRLKREKIMLPVTEDGAPDFEFMENFTRNKFAETIRRYLEYLGVFVSSDTQSHCLTN